VDASGTTVATAQTNARGEYAFRRLDIGSYRVVVTPAGGPAVTSRGVSITRGGQVKGVDVGVASPAQRPTPKPLNTPPAARPSVAMDAAFAGLGGATPPAPGTARRR
jgi:hypothetical protein